MPTAAKKISKSTLKVQKPIAKTDEIGVGARIPSFSLPATRIGKVSSSSLKGDVFILYFYPKDDTSGCTLEACAFNDALPKFDKLGVTVIGVSKDSIESHEKFAKKYNLSFPLASDKDNDVCDAFGVWKQKSMYGRVYMGIERSTFLVDGKGIIRAAWRKVSVTGHAEDVKKAIAEL